MKCPHCDHKIGFFRFMLTVVNPWGIRCSKCAKTYSIGRKGNLILLVSAAAATVMGLAMFNQPIPIIAGAALGFGALIEYLIWALDEPAKKGD